MAVGDDGLTLMSSITLSTPTPWFSFINLWDGNYDGLYCTANILVTETTTCAAQVLLPGGSQNALILNYMGVNNNAITANRWTTNYGGISTSKIWNSAASSAQGAATISFEFWIPNRKISGINKNCIFHGGSGEGVTNANNKYVWVQGAVSSRTTTHINDFYIRMSNTSNTLINAQNGSSVQLYGMRKT